MESLNLNVDEYSNFEIEEILSLTYPYSENDIKLKQQSLYDKLLGDNSVNLQAKNEITKFLNDISHRLEKIIKNMVQGQQESVPDKSNNFNNLKNTVNEVNSHFLIVQEGHKKEAYSSISSDGISVGNGAPPGIINPVQYKTIKKAVNIDSKFRPNYYKTSSSDQKLTLPCKFEKVINMSLASIEFPLCFYAISEGQGNNSFRIDWDLSGQDIEQDYPFRPFNNSVLVKIPDGNYNNINSGGSPLIESAINAAMNASIKIPKHGSNTINPEQKTIQDDLNFNLRYTVDNISGRSCFALDVSGIENSTLQTLIDNGSLAYKITFGISTTGELINNDPLPFFLGWQLGYRIVTYYSGPGNITNNILPASIVSEGICYPSGPSYIFLAIDDYNNNVNNYYTSAYTDSINNRDILARINIASIVQGNGYYRTGEDDGFSTQLNRSRQYFGPVDIEKLRITLYDEYGRQLILNNMDWSCALMFECIYS